MSVAGLQGILSFYTSSIDDLIMQNHQVCKITLEVFGRVSGDEQGEMSGNDTVGKEVTWKYAEKGGPPVAYHKNLQSMRIVQIFTDISLMMAKMGPNGDLSSKLRIDSSLNLGDGHIEYSSVEFCKGVKGLIGSPAWIEQLFGSAAAQGRFLEEGQRESASRSVAPVAAPSVAPSVAPVAAQSSLIASQPGCFNSPMPHNATAAAGFNGYSSPGATHSYDYFNQAEAQSSSAAARFNGYNMFGAGEHSFY